MTDTLYKSDFPFVPFISEIKYKVLPSGLKAGVFIKGLDCENKKVVVLTNASIKEAIFCILCNEHSLTTYR